MKENLDDILSKLTKAVQKLTDTPITPVVPINSMDHDMLQRLDTKVDALKDDIKELKDGTTKRIDDLDVVTKCHERDINKIKAWGAALVIAIGIAQFIIGKYF